MLYQLSYQPNWELAILWYNRRDDEMKALRMIIYFILIISTGILRIYKMTSSQLGW